MAIVLKAENVSIRYITGDFKDIGLKEYTVRKLTGNYRVKEFMAVDGVSFELQEGDMLGIIGSNGAGKSTLLKAVARIMEPTRGKITANGEIAALLELGSGFDGDLTVKENAYLRGAMLGYTKEFMDQTYDQIIDFAELREFEDRPFKQLSSGMKSRLAFSIASLVKPDILILDEVLSVGDGAFQEKSAQKMREIISQGATTILVSHSLDQIRELCNKVLWLDRGQQVAFGETQEICDRYERFLQGECLAEMPGQSKAENVENLNIQEEGHQTKRLKSAHRPSARRVVAGLAIAVFIAIFAINLGIPYLEASYSSHVVIVAHEGSGTVIFRGAFTDGIWVGPAQHTEKSDGWIYDAEQDIYTAVNGKPLEFLLPAGQGRELIFYAGPDAGVVSVDVDGELFEFNLRNEAVEELGLAYHVQESSIQSMLEQLQVIALISFIAAFTLSLSLGKEPLHPAKQEREIWIDALKVISAIMVVLIHCAGDVYNNSFGVDSTLWLQGLWANAIPRFAVPCFLMITGAMSLTKQYDLKKVKQKVVHILLPLFFWSLMHVLCAKIRWGSDVAEGVLKMPFTPQDGTLWYGYQLIWLMMGMPFWSLLWEMLSTKKRWVFVIFSLGIPGLLTHIEEILVLNTNEYLPFASVNPIVCYVGMLFLGRLLYEVIENKISGKVLMLGAASIIIGLLLMVVSSAYVSSIAQYSVHTFFSEVRITGVLYGSGVFLCFGGLRKMFSNCAGWIKNSLEALSNVSLGVYLIHALLIYKLLPQTIVVMGVPLNKSINVGQLVACTLVYYGISASICLLIAKIPKVKLLVA